ncbi:MAG: hypothetical protein HRU36_02575 [Rickettsiales bacterium]|nr:hypothetical protein [Rickettsiales bacterium]
MTTVDLQNIKEQINALSYSQKKYAWRAFEILKDTEYINRSPKFVSQYHIWVLEEYESEHALIAVKIGDALNALGYNQQNKAWETIKMLGHEEYEKALSIYQSIKALSYGQPKYAWQAFEILKDTEYVSQSPKFTSQYHIRMLEEYGNNKVKFVLSVFDRIRLKELNENQKNILCDVVISLKEDEHIANKILDMLMHENFFIVALQDLEFVRDILTEYTEIKYLIDQSDFIKTQFTEEQIDRLSKKGILDQFPLLLHPSSDEFENININTVRYVLETGYDSSYRDKLGNAPKHLSICSAYNQMMYKISQCSRSMIFNDDIKCNFNTYHDEVNNKPKQYEYECEQSTTIQGTVIDWSSSTSGVGISYKCKHEISSGVERFSVSDIEIMQNRIFDSTYVKLLTEYSSEDEQTNILGQNISFIQNFCHELSGDKSDILLHDEL